MLFPYFSTTYIKTDHDNYDLKWGPRNMKRVNVYDWRSSCYWSRVLR